MILVLQVVPNVCLVNSFKDENCHLIVVWGSVVSIHVIYVSFCTNIALGPETLHNKDAISTGLGPSLLYLLLVWPRALVTSIILVGPRDLLSLWPGALLSPPMCFLFPFEQKSLQSKDYFASK